MGQNQSSEKEKSSSRAGTPHADRKVNRRISIQQFSRPQPADASASTVAAQGTTTHNIDSPNLEKMLQSTSPDFASKSNRVERSTSGRKRDAEARTAERQPTQPLSMPGLAPANSIDIPTTANTNVLPTRSREEELQDNSKDYDQPSAAVSFNRPPRFPLPIAEVPDSPHLSPVVKTEPNTPVFGTEDSVLPARRNSMLSVATQDEEDVGEELQPFGVGFSGQTVPYTIEWNHGANEKVFVTGTFAAWDKKYRLRKSDSVSGRFKTVINLPPGTHHLKFFVDGHMVTSPDLPTAVDFNNILVNYVEISTDDIPKTTRRESGQIPQKQPPYQASPRFDAQEQPEQYSGTVTPGEEVSSIDALPEEEMPEGDFRQVTPQALVDIDLPEDDPRYKQAAQVIQDSPAPPSLPLFLSRSILNGNLPVKDDSSVLALPNHTVLNHLMTSNVRNGVLATSATTRYKKKYVTTISFKPVPKPQPQET